MKAVVFDQYGPPDVLWVEEVETPTPGERGPAYDVIVDAGAYRSLFEVRRALAEGGRYVLVGGSFGTFLQAALLGPLFSMGGKRTFRALMATPNPNDLETIREMIDTGKVRPRIDRTFGLEEAAEAVGYVEDGRAQGKVVIRVGSASG